MPITQLLRVQGFSVDSSQSAATGCAIFSECSLDPGYYAEAATFYLNKTGGALPLLYNDTSSLVTAAECLSACLTVHCQVVVPVSTAYCTPNQTFAKIDVDNR